MQARPNTDLLCLMRAGGESRALLAMTLLPEAARSLAARLGLGDGPEARRLLAARLKALGVCQVFWDDSLTEAQTGAEAAELLRRLESGEGLPLMLAGCPRWYSQAGQMEAALAGHFTLLAPHMRCRGLAVRSLLTARLGVSFSRIAHVTVVGCPAQKERYSRFGEDPRLCIGEEYVITAREAALWLGMQEPLPLTVGREPRPATEGVGAGRLLRVLTQARALRGEGENSPEALTLRPVEGHPALRQGVAYLGGRALHCAQLRGLHEAPWLLEQLQSGACQAELVEVLACAGCQSGA